MINREYLQTLAQACLPQHWLSRCVGMAMASRIPWLKNTLIDWFIDRYNVDMQTALQPDPHAYANFNSFFTRALKPEARPIASEKAVIASPADGCISEMGSIQAGQLLQAKNFYYDVQSLLGGETTRAQPFLNGQFMTVYLSPRDYHRVHMPVSGRLREMIYIPGRLFSVNPATTRNVPCLFARNERVVSIYDTEVGPMAIILVGAMLVASIATVWSGIVTPPQKQAIQQWSYENDTIYLKRGEEMGHFQLGSTVILLFANNMQWAEKLSANQVIQVGEAIGQITI